MVECLEALAGVTAAQGRAEKAARLIGATTAQRELDDLPPANANTLLLQRLAALSNPPLDDPALQAARESGRGLSLEETVTLVINE
jgi:hypothetical protein